MRAGQNNKRMRGRPNGRKGPNPLTRSYESSGPDVKVRGTAQHIGEKYLQLARDAQASGDPVMAESYLQHAEHYFRLIAVAQQAQQHVLGAYQPQPGDAIPEEAEDEVDFGGVPDRFASPLERLSPPQQPNFLPQPQPPASQSMSERSSHGNGDRQGFARPERAPRPDRPFQDRNFRDRDIQPSTERPYQEQRGYQERNGRGRDQESHGSRGPRPYRTSETPFRNDQRVEAQMAEARIEGSGLPAFITAPVRVATEAHEPAASGETRAPLRASSPDIDVAASGFQPRPRRRRSAKAEPEVTGLGGDADENATNPVQD